MILLVGILLAFVVIILDYELCREIDGILEDLDDD
jgi:hypothetical protein